MNHHQLWKILRDGNTRPLYLLLRNLYVVKKYVCFQERTVRTGCGTMDWFKVGRGVCKAVYYHPAYFLVCRVKSESEVAQSCPTLCDPMDGSPPSSSVHGIFQARVLEWVARPSSRASSQHRDQAWVSCIAGGFFTPEPPGKPLSGGWNFFQVTEKWMGDLDPPLFYSEDLKKEQLPSLASGDVAICPW